MPVQTHALLACTFIASYLDQVFVKNEWSLTAANGLLDSLHQSLTGPALKLWYVFWFARELGLICMFRAPLSPSVTLVQPNLIQHFNK